MAHDGTDPRAPYYLGNLLYDLQPERAMELWRRALERDCGGPECAKAQTQLQSMTEDHR